jgi:hypothetical protein
MHIILCNDHTQDVGTMLDPTGNNRTKARQIKATENVILMSLSLLYLAQE